MSNCSNLTDTQLIEIARQRSGNYGHSSDPNAKVSFRGQDNFKVFGCYTTGSGKYDCGETGYVDCPESAAKPPTREDPEVLVKTLSNGYKIYKVRDQYHLYDAQGNGLGLYTSIESAITAAGVDANPPAIPDLPKCPKGSSFAGNAVIAVTRDCGVGYQAVGGLLNTKCVCTSLTPEEQFKEMPTEVKEFYETPEKLKDVGYGSLGDFGLKDSSLLIIALVAAVIIGVLRR